MGIHFWQAKIWILFFIVKNPLPKGLCVEIVGVLLGQEGRKSMTVNVCSVISGWIKWTDMGGCCEEKPTD